MKKTVRFTLLISLLISGAILLSAWPVAQGRMTGGGFIFLGSMKITHGFELHCDASHGPNNLEVNWGGGNHFHLDTLTAASCYDTGVPPNPPNAPFDTYFGAGTGTYNGAAGAFANWGFSDHGEPGTNDQILYLIISDASGNIVLSAGPVNLSGGNQQAHAEN